MVYYKQRNKDKCPIYDEFVRTSGGKWYAQPLPCRSSTKFGENGCCEHLSQWWATRYNCTVRCKHKIIVDGELRK